MHIHKSGIAVIGILVMGLAGTLPAQAVDPADFFDRIFNCDGPGIVLADKASAGDGTEQTEARGYAMLDLVDAIISKPGETAGLSDFAKANVDTVRTASAAKAAAIVERCGIVPKVPDGSTAKTVPNPLEN